MILKKLKITSVFAVVMILTFTLAACDNGNGVVEEIESEPEIVEIEDSNLETAVREEIDYEEGQINKELIKDISHLETNTGGIKSLKGLEYFESLEWLDINQGDLGPNEISDLSPLFELEKLYSLVIDDNDGFNDLNQLKELENLERFLITHNHDIEDFSPLAELTNLTYLNLGNTGMNNEDLEYISDLTDLEELFFWDNNITDISAIQNLINLRRLSYSHFGNQDRNEIKDISPLENLINLERLFVQGAGNIQDFSPLAGLNILLTLNISDTGFKDEDTEYLKDLENIEILGFYNNYVTDISFLENLNNLNLLSFADNEVEDISPLLNIENWEEGDEIWMSGNNFDLDDQNIKDIIEKLKEKGVTVNYQE